MKKKKKKEKVRIVWNTTEVIIFLVQNSVCMLLCVMRRDMIMRKDNLKSYLGKASVVLEERGG